MPELRISSLPGRTVILRVALALGLTVLLLIGAWTDSHGESAAPGAVCVAEGVSAGAAAHEHGSSVVDAAASDIGVLGICVLIVFLLVLLMVRMLHARALLHRGRVVAAPALPRAGPAARIFSLTLEQLSVSRT